MDVSPAPDVDENMADSQDASKRQSGRARRKPDLFSSQSYSGAAKRKRPSSNPEDNSDASDSGSEQEDNQDDEPEEEEEEEDEQDTDGEADEEELKERRKKERSAAKQKKKEPKKTKSSHAAKKPKVANGTTRNLALRPVANGQRTTTKAKKSRARPSGLVAEDEEGLFAEVFARGHTTEASAAQWLTKYEQHNINAMCDLINFVLRCSGTDLKISDHDIEDVDNVPNRLNDLQEEYQAQGITEYPLTSRSKKYKSFQSILVSFFDSLIKTIHSSSVLYNDAALVENIQIWITSMSSASIRPFRHTATIISLAIMTTLCRVAREVSATLSNSRKQMESEKKKKRVNKGRVSAMQTKVQEHEKKLETIDDALRDSFDTVFVHRYRDVDPKIRAECMALLGEWIVTYKEVFFDGQYLRYLGWVLSDTVAATRAIVVHQLNRLYQNKDNIAGLRSFTERFRPRIVEMAIRDAEVTVRAAAIDLLDHIRDAGLLEPDDIDSIGRLVFDAESRVRKAAGKFFVANVRDVYEATIEGLDEDMNEFFADEDEDDFETPKRAWVNYKCLVDTLHIYDGQESNARDEQDHSVSRTGLVGGRVDSRYVLATEAIYPHLQELHQWEFLAGYLLYDHSQIPEESDDSDPATKVKSLYRLSEGQEPILLEVLGCAVKLHIQEVARSGTDRRGKKTKQLVEKMEERQELNAHNLSQIIPQLLSKFGAVPEAASAVLRLEHLVNLDLIHDLQKDAAAYSDLIGNINKQFLTHSDQNVLAEATVAFLHAQSSDELKEAMESKVQELWDDTVDSLRNLASKKKLDESQSLSTNVLTTLSNTVVRIANLVTVSDCTSILESAPARTSKKQKGTQDPPVDILLGLAKRGLREEEDDDEANAMETELVLGSFKTLLTYFMWKIKAINAALSSGNGSLDEVVFESLSERRDLFVSTLTAIMQQQPGIADIRISATTTLLDLQAVFGTLRHAGLGEQSNVQDLDENLIFRSQSLAQEISPETQSLISRIHNAAERYFAKKSNRKLEPAAEDEPLDTESEIGISSDEEDEAGAADDDEETIETRRTRTMLLAEQKLCQLTGKMVLAIAGQVLDASGPEAGKLRQKLLKNRTRLGPNYKEVLAYLEDGKSTGGGRRTAATAKQKQGGPAPGQKSNGAAGAKRNDKAKSAVRVDEDDEDEDEEVHAEEDEEQDLQARGLLEDEPERRDEEGGNEVESPRTPDDADAMGD